MIDPRLLPTIQTKLNISGVKKYILLVFEYVFRIYFFNG